MFVSGGWKLVGPLYKANISERCQRDALNAVIPAATQFPLMESGWVRTWSVSVCECQYSFLCVYLQMEDPLWVWTVVKIFHSSLSFWASGQTHFHTCMHQMSHLLGLPDLQHRHASNDRVGIFLGSRVHRIIGADHQGQVRLWMDTQKITLGKNINSFKPFFFLFFFLWIHSLQPSSPWRYIPSIFSSQLILSHMCQALKTTVTPIIGALQQHAKSNPSHPVFWRHGAHVTAHLVGDWAWHRWRRLKQFLQGDI